MYEHKAGLVRAGREKSETDASWLCDPSTKPCWPHNGMKNGAQRKWVIKIHNLFLYYEYSSFYA